MFFGTIHKMLRFAFPEQPWDFKNISNRGKKSKQMYVIVSNESLAWNLPPIRLLHRLISFAVPELKVIEGLKLSPKTSEPRNDDSV